MHSPKYVQHFHTVWLLSDAICQEQVQLLRQIDAVSQQLIKR